MSERKRSGPKRAYTKAQLAEAVDRVVRAAPDGEMKEAAVASALRDILQRPSYVVRSGSLQPEINEILAERAEAETRRQVAELPERVRKAAEEESARASYALLAALGSVFQPLKEHAQVPLQAAEDEIARLREAFDSERRKRRAETERADAAEHRAEAAESEVGTLKGENARLAARIQELEAEKEGFQKGAASSGELMAMMKKVLAGQQAELRSE
ncbi:MAG: hypothetical protein ACNS61_05895 [Candidatus Wenzhouxiangella sp. M2_3B_020]